MIFQKNYRTVGWPNFSQIGSRVADLGFKTYPQQADYNTKAVNVDAYQRRDNNSDTAGKVENETRQQMNNLFQRLCSVRSFLLSRKLHQLFATGSFHFRTGQAKLSQAHFYSIHFLKVRHFPGKIDNKPLSGVFLETSFPLQQTFKTVLRPIFIRRGTSQTPGKNSEHYTYKPRFLSNCVISLVQQRHAYQV